MYMRSPNAKVLVREERVVLCNTRNGGFVKTSEAYFQYLEKYLEENNGEFTIKEEDTVVKKNAYKLFQELCRIHFYISEEQMKNEITYPYQIVYLSLTNRCNQNQEDYYVYFYMVQCPFCNQVKDKMLNFAAENDNVYFVDYALRENRPLQKYNWAATRSKYNKKIGYVDSDGNKVFLPGESEEKYQNMKNDYGKRMRFNFVTITPEDIPAFPGSQVGDIYTDIQTPEIDYASITKYEDMLIAGVPALYRISNGKITEFYFDSVEIEEFFNSIGR